MFVFFRILFWQRIHSCLKRYIRRLLEVQILVVSHSTSFWYSHELTSWRTLYLVGEYRYPHPPIDTKGDLFEDFSFVTHEPLKKVSITLVSLFVSSFRIIFWSKSVIYISSLFFFLKSRWILTLYDVTSMGFISTRHKPVIPRNVDRGTRVLFFLLTGQSVSLCKFS